MLEATSVFGVSLYDLINVIAHVGMVVLIICTIKKYKEFCTLPKLAAASFKKTDHPVFKWVWYLLEAIFIFLVLLVISEPLIEGISYLFLGAQSTNYFYNIFLVPLILFLLGILLKVSPFRLTDYVAPIESFALIFYKLACYFQGCCYGVALPETAKCIVPFYNYRKEQYQVPVQFIEMTCAVVMFIVLILLDRRKNRKTGLLYPLFMLMYCGSRFISEFWRGDYPAVWGRLTGYHIQCIIGFSLGAVYLAVVLVWGKRITAFFETKNEAWLNKKLAAGKSKKKSRAHGKKQPIVHAKKRKKK